MTTIWTLPTIISQYDEPGAPVDDEMSNVAWDDSSNFQELLNIGNSLLTKKNLQHIARSPKYDLRNNTYFISLSGFNFVNLPNILSGISLKVTANRRGRISDDTIQLSLNGELIGDNYAGTNLDPIQIYGSSTDLWKTNLTITDIKNPEFGVILRFRAHPKWPHSDGMYLDAVELQIS